jgi:dTDP-glucose 4,6-dehydratase
MSYHKRILVTGGCGFIGSNFIRHVLARRAWEVVNLDALTYAGNRENLADIEKDSRYRFVNGRIEDAPLVEDVCAEVDSVVHFAAESHVDRSIEDACPFIQTNVLGTQVLLDAARRSERFELFVHVSTDEVYGSLHPEDPAFTEQSPLRPNSPYAASKAASDMLARAAWKTHGLPIVVTRCSNNYGPYQFPEKLIPLMINNALNDKDLPVYGDGLQVRDWLYVYDHCAAIWQVMEKAPPGEIYNIGGCNEKTNMEVVDLILSRLGKPKSLIKHVTDRPGHDRRYAIDAGRIISDLNWRPSVSFEQGIEKTIDWYVQNPEWLANVVSGEYQKYYESMYGNR